MRTAIVAIITGMLFSAGSTAADAQQLVTRPRLVFPSNFSSSFPARHYGSLSMPSNYGYLDAGPLRSSRTADMGLQGYSTGQDFAAPSFGLGGYPLSFAPAQNNGGLLPMAPGGAVAAPEGAPTLTPGETIHAGSSWTPGRD